MDLPVASVLEQVVSASRQGTVIVTAPAGSGKTTLVPGAILDDLPPLQKVLLVQPRRMAARAVARRMAFLRASDLGKEVGYQVRFDRRATDQTRLLVATTGVLLRKLLDDMVLEETGAVVLDEFHERSTEMDLALGFLVRIQQTIRPDLRLVLMSATLAGDGIAARLDGCPVVHSEGRVYPVEIHYEERPDARPLPARVASTVSKTWDQTAGHVLVFLPGVGEILRCRDELAAWADKNDVALLSLYGDLPPEQQDAVLETSQRRKLILATNVAETSLTIEGVTGVIDSGLARQSNVHPAVGLPRLELVPISRASADQRAGRAGRTVAGHCWRLWSRADHHARRDRELPELLRSELSQCLLQLLACGERRIEEFPWIDPPPADAISAARGLLQRLGAIDDADRVTRLGQQLIRTPAHPRLGRLLLAGAEHGALTEAALAAALLSERDPFRTSRGPTSGPRDRQIVRSRSDLVDRVHVIQARQSGRRSPDLEWDCPASAVKPITRAADQLARTVDTSAALRSPEPETALERALLAAFPDRLAQLRPGSQDRAVMVGGRGVRLDDSSRLRGVPLFLCVELNDGPGDARVRMASAVEREWLPSALLRTTDELFFHPSRGQVEARRRTYFDDLLIEETPTGIQDHTAAATLLAHHASSKLEPLLPGDDEAAGKFRGRVQWLASRFPDLGITALELDLLRERLPHLCHGLRSLEELRRIDWLSAFQSIVGYEKLTELDRLAPATWEVPSGNRIALHYDERQGPILAVRIQELFGLRETPRIAGGRVPLLLHLLGPNYRVQQVTDDLASFWKNTYPIVKKELLRRYPKHAWPDDPLTATPARSGLKPRRP